jgi:hypothetical protein
MKVYELPQLRCAECGQDLLLMEFDENGILRLYHCGGECSNADTTVRFKVKRWEILC